MNDPIFVTVKTEILISQQLVDSILITAFDGNHGGCWYWAAPANEDWAEFVPKGDEDGDWWSIARVRDKEDNDSPVYAVSAEVIALGIRKILNGELNDSWQLEIGHRLTEDPNLPDLDADDVDVIVQMGLFGEVMYG